MRHFLAAMAAFLILPMAAVQALDFTPHRASYDMGFLKRATESSFAQVDGRMVYDFDRTCEAITYNHRMVLDLVSKQGIRVTSETVLSFYETIDGRAMRFQIRELLNDRVVTELEGSVNRPAVDAAATVTYDKREGIEEDPVTTLPPNVLFPLQHTHAVLEAAQQGQIIHNAKTFDGDDISLVDSFIQPVSGPGREGEVMSSETLAEPSWLTRVSFYKPDSEEESPHYETQMRLWASGLSGDFTMESQELGVLATLKEVELLDAPECD